MGWGIVMKKIICIFTTLLLVFTAFMGNGNEAFAEADPQRVIVKFKEGAQTGIAAADVAASDENGKAETATIEVTEGESMENYMEELKERDYIEFVEPDYQIELAVKRKDPELAARQYHHKQIHTAAAWKQTKGSKKVVVAVIDDGMDVTHPELKKQFIAPYD